jgi:O-antigen/teichoic acid export membrane protein
MNMDKYLNTDHLSRDIKRITVRGGAITSIAQVLKEILTIGSTVILARLLTPQDYGMIAMVVAVTGFVGLFKDMGLSMATVQRPEISHEQVSTLFWVNMLVSVVICLITAGVSPLISWYYKEPRLVLITVALASGFIFGGLTIQHQALLRRQMRFKSLVKIELASLVLSICCRHHMPLYAGLRRLVVGGAERGQAGRFGRWRVDRLPVAARHGSSPSRKVWDLLKFGGNLTGFNVINYFSRNLDNLLIGRFFRRAAARAVRQSLQSAVTTHPSNQRPHCVRDPTGPQPAVRRTGAVPAGLSADTGEAYDRSPCRGSPS